jgi:hypothetical protein
MAAPGCHSGRRGAAIRNLKIPGSCFARPGMTSFAVHFVTKITKLQLLQVVMLHHITI